MNFNAFSRFVRWIGAVSIFVWVSSIGANLYADNMTQPSSGYGDRFTRLKTIAASLKGMLRERGYQVADGAYFYLRNEYCRKLVDTINTCMGINVGTPYGLALLPLLPGEAAPPYDLTEFFQAIDRKDLVGLSPIWRLEPTEAVVSIGLTPPKARYYSYTTYWFQTPVNGRNGTDGYRLVWAETDLPINERLVQRRLGGETPFLTEIAMITSADMSVIHVVEDLLVDTLKFDANRIFSYGIPTADIELPMGLEKSNFHRQDRVAYPEDGEGYLEDPPVLVFRVTPRRPHPDFEPIAMWNPPDRTSANNEHYLGHALDALVDAVVQANLRPDRSVAVTPIHPFPVYSQYCLWGILLSCDNPVADSAYGFNFLTTVAGFGPSESDYDVIVGVNHVLTGKANYSNMNFLNTKASAPIGAFSDAQMNGASVEPFLPYLKPHLRRVVEKYQGYLYTMKVGRHCEADDPYCIEIEYPSTRAVGLDDFEAYNYFERIVSEPTGNYGPLTRDLRLARVVHVRALRANESALKGE